MHTQPRPSLTNVVLVAAIGTFFAAVYALLDEPAPPLVGLFVALAPVIAVASWFQRYLAWARQRVPYDYGYFLLIGWWLLIPMRAVQLHGRRGWRLVVLLYALVLAPELVAAVVQGVTP